MSKALATKNVAAVLLGIGMLLSVFAFATPAKVEQPELTPPPVVKTTPKTNQEDCVSRGGKYYLSVGPDKYDNTEFCDINQRIHY